MLGAFGMIAPFRPHPNCVMNDQNNGENNRTPLNGKDPKEHKPYISPAMLSIDREEKIEREEEEAKRKALDAKKSAKAKSTSYQPLSFVMADLTEREDAPKRTPQSSGAQGSRSFSAEEEQVIQRAAAKSGARKNAVQPPKRTKNPPITVVHGSGKKSVPPVGEKAKQKPSGAKKKAKRRSGNGDPALRRAPAPKKRPEKNKKRRKNNYLLYYVGFGVIAMIALTILSLTVLFPVREITVVPTDETITLTEEQQQELITASGVLTGNNLLRLNAGDIRERILNASNLVDDVKLSRKLPSKAVLEVNVAKPKYVLYAQKTYYTISENNRVMNITDSHADVKGLMCVNGFSVEECAVGSFYDEYAVLSNRAEMAKQALESETDSEKKAELEEAATDAAQELRRYEMFLELTDKLSEAGFTDVTYVSLKLSSDICFTYAGRIRVNLGGYTDIDYKLSLASEIIFTQLEENVKGTLNLTVPSLPGFQKSK